jgi:starch phosphorylase
VRCNEEVDRVYGDQRAWQQKSLMNIARIGWFSSDRAVQEYTRDVWHLQPCPLEHQ